MLIGLESAAPASLEGIDVKNWKLKQFDRYHRGLEVIQSFGISVNGCFILGFDTDDTGIFELTEQFISSSNLAEVQITLLTPFPGTQLYKKLQQENRLLEEVFWDRCTLFDTTFHPKLMAVDELSAGFRWLMKRLYSEKEYAVRRQKFKQCIGTSRYQRGSKEP